MKKILIGVVVVIIVLIAFLYFFKNGGDGNRLTEDAGTGTESRERRPDPMSATFIFDDGPITLSQGKAEQSLSPDGASIEEITLSEHIAYGDLSNDERQDAGVVLLRSGGGSGLFVYVAGFVSGNPAKGTNAVFIGDRILPETLEIEDGVLTLKYLDRGPDEPFAAEPTISRTKSFRYTSGRLEEL